MRKGVKWAKGHSKGTGEKGSTGITMATTIAAPRFAQLTANLHKAPPNLTGCQRFTTGDRADEQCGQGTSPSQSRALHNPQTHQEKE